MNPFPRYLGIDPGADGGFAVLGNGPAPVIADVFPTLGAGIDWATWSTRLGHYGVTVAVVEKVHSMPGQGVRSMFSMGHNLGMIEGILIARHIPYLLVAPQTWKRVILRDSDRDKAAAIAFCRRAWPDTDLRRSERARLAHDGKADALCIAEYCRRIQRKEDE